MKLFMFELPTLKIFLICSYFLPISANLFILTIFYCGSYSGKTLLHKHLRFLRAEAVKWTKTKQLLSTSQAQIVPRLKQLTSQLSVFLVAEN